MENLFNYITYLTKYFNLLVKTEEAAELMKQEIDTKTVQWSRCIHLRKECVRVYDNLFLTFDNRLIELGNEVSIEISKRDTKGQELFYAQLFDIINQFRDKFNDINKGAGFSEELIGTKFSKAKIERADGTQEESIKYDFSIAMLADDLCDKFNQLQAIINERFKFLKRVDHSNNGAGESLHNQNPKHFEFPPIPDGILKPVGMGKLLEIEKLIKEAGFFIDETGRWIRTLQDLADFMWAFKVNNYFKSKNDKFIKEEKQFFKIRYKKTDTQLDQYLYPSKKVEFAKNQFNHYFT